MYNEELVFPRIRLGVSTVKIERSSFNEICQLIGLLQSIKCPIVLTPSQQLFDFDELRNIYTLRLKPEHYHIIQKLIGEKYDFKDTHVQTGLATMYFFDSDAKAKEFIKNLNEVNIYPIIDFEHPNGIEHFEHMDRHDDYVVTLKQPNCDVYIGLENFFSDAPSHQQLKDREIICEQFLAEFVEKNQLIWDDKFSNRILIQQLKGILLQEMTAEEKIILMSSYTNRFYYADILKDDLNNPTMRNLMAAVISLGEKISNPSNFSLRSRQQNRTVTYIDLDSDTDNTPSGITSQVAYDPNNSNQYYNSSSSSSSSAQSQTPYNTPTGSVQVQLPQRQQTPTLNTNTNNQPRL